jgi:prophage DNA circulation protein
MSVRTSLQTASFRGVEFLVESETKTGGKKTVTHEYVNSNSRFTEELGQLPPSFSIEAVVHGDDGIQRRFDLERVLNIPDIGELVHPVYGTLQVKSTTYSVSSNQVNIGQFRFSINFQTSREVINPAPSEIISTAEATKNAESVRTVLDDALENQYVDPGIPETLDSAANKLDLIYQAVETAISDIVGLIQENVAEFTKVVSDGRRRIFTTVQEGSTLKTALTDLYSSALSVTAMPEELGIAWESLIDFGISEPVGKTNTVFRANEENNRLILNEHTRVNALINLYESAAFNDYATDLDIDQIRTVLNDAYITQMNSASGLLTMEPGVRTALSQLRTTVNKILDEKEQNIWRVVIISPGKSSMLLAGFRYYGSLDTLDLLQQLNPEVNTANFNQDITAVSR